VEIAFVVTYVSFWALMTSSVSAVTTTFVNILFFIYFPLYNACVFSDPGIISAGSEPGEGGGGQARGYQAVGSENEALDLEDGAQPAVDPEAPSRDGVAHGVVCETCHVIRPLRAKHCKVCGRCVETMDHHCIFTGNCVGAGNRLLFVAMVYSALASHLLICHCVVMASGGYPAVFSGSLDKHPYFGALLAFHSLCSLFMLALVVFHTYSISVNITTNEFWNWQRYRHFHGGTQFGIPVFKNPFDKGVKINWQEFLSSQCARCPPRLGRSHFS